MTNACWGGLGATLRHMIHAAALYTIYSVSNEYKIDNDEDRYLLVSASHAIPSILPLAPVNYLHMPEVARDRGKPALIGEDY